MAANSAGRTTWSGNLTAVPHLTQGAIETWSEESENIPRRKQDKGYEKWLEGFIHEIQVMDDDDYQCRVRALSYRSMAKNERPYKVEVVLLKSQRLTVQSSSCQCKAGSAKCSHLVALLYNLAHFQKLGLTAVPSVVSKTSKPQQWHVPSRDAGIRPHAVDSLTISKVKPPKRLQAKKKKKRITEGIVPNLYCLLPAGIPWLDIATDMKAKLEVSAADCQLLLLLPDASAQTAQTNAFGAVPKGSVLATQQPHMEDGDIIFQDAPPPFPCVVDAPQETLFHCVLRKAEQDVFASMQYGVETCIEIERKTLEQSKTPLWKSAREKRVTASQFHRVVVRRKDHHKLAAALSMTKHVQTKAMKHGIEGESEAAKAYASITGCNVYKAGLVLNIHAPHLGASPDRKVFDAAASPHFGLLEIKCPLVNTFTEVQCLKEGSNGVYKLKKTHEYYHQVMGQMGLTGLLWCDFFVMCRDNYHLERIHFDREVWRDMKMKLDAFFFQYQLPLLASR